MRGNVVADVSHLLAELLDNATSFSPPDSYVRVGGRMAEQGYMIRIVDNGVGMGTQRLKDLNELLREPPVVGLSVESTLGMSVVSLLANKHGITVKLASGNPGLIVDVLLPPSLYGPIDAQPSAAPATAVATMQAAPPQKPIVAWDDNALTAGAPTDETFETQGPVTTYESAAPATAGPAMGDDDRPVTQSDWRAMSLNLTAFQQGMRSASDSSEQVDADDEVFEPAEPVVAEAPVDEIQLPKPTPTPPTRSPSPKPTSTPSTTRTHDDADVEDTEYALFDGVQESADAEPADPEIADAESVETLTTPITNDIEQTVSFVERDDDEVGVPEDHQTLQAPDTPDTSVEQTAGADQESIEALAAQVADDPTDAEVFAAAPTPDEALTVPSLPPPAGGPRAEFSVPPAPPMTASGPRPVSPDNARTVSRPAVQQEAAPSLPTRSPSDGPDGGPDRLANALDAALPTRSPSPGPDGGFDRLSGDNAPMPLDAAEGSLPTRTRVGDPSDPVEEPLATAQSNSDPDALRDRLRAFQAEFRSALSTDDVDHSDGNGAQDHNHESANHDHAEEAGQNHLDLGGDPR